MQTFFLFLALVFSPLAFAALPVAGIPRNHDGRELSAAEEAVARQRAAEDAAIRLAVDGKYEESDAVRLHLVDGSCNPFAGPCPGQVPPPPIARPAPIPAPPIARPTPAPPPPGIVYPPVVVNPFPVVPVPVVPYLLAPAPTVIYQQPVLVYPAPTASVVTLPQVALAPLQPTLPPPLPQGFIIVERTVGVAGYGNYCWANGEAFKMAFPGTLNALCRIDNSTFGGYVGYGRVIP